MTAGLRALPPGLSLLAVVAAAAWAVGSAVPLLTPLVVAIGIGAVLANTYGIPGWAQRGIGKHSLLLETAIVLLGADLSAEAITTAGPPLVALVLAVVVSGVVLVTVLTRAARLNERMGSLLAAGSSICGVSAIAAVAPVCDARETQIAHAAATILVFDAVTLVTFPAIGRLLHLEPRFYGVWIGLSMFSTGPVAAAGFAHSAVAGKWATMTKLTRNALIGAIAVWYSVRYSARGAGETDATAERLWTDFPKFLIGFLLLAALTTAGVVPDAVVSAIGETSDALFLVAFAGLGFEIRVDEMRNAGIRPAAIVGTYLVVMSGLTYVTVTLLF
jgi:uncharacterized integral membrane protein (TIGR00698 family)